jgi:23S rRNA (adenine2503-C2)-methyltransferase
MDKIDFRNNEIGEITRLFLSNGFSLQKIKNFRKSFRTGNFTKIHEMKGVRGFDKISSLLPFMTLKIFDSIRDNEGNEKFIFLTHDDLKIESIFMPGKSGFSICISTQAGCRMNCRFCKTGISGLKRNLMACEILEQLRLIYLSRIHPNKIDCVTFMGMGEPFDNLENCRLAFEWINSEWGYQVSREKITFSTIVTNNFIQILNWKRLPNLAVSLHSSDEKRRTELIPSSLKDLKEIKALLTRYTEMTGKQLTVEYCMLKGINDTEKDANELAEYLKDLKCKVNLMNYNTINGLDFSPVSPIVLQEFREILKKQGIPVLIRKSLGTKINAGCGQLG